MKYYLAYVLSYILLSFLSIYLNDFIGISSEASPNVFVQIGCIWFLVKKISNSRILSIKEKFFLPVFFATVSVLFLFVIDFVFPTWEENNKDLTLFSVSMVFIFNYIIGFLTTFYVSKKYERKSPF